MLGSITIAVDLETVLVSNEAVRLTFISDRATHGHRLAVIALLHYQN